MAVGVWGLVFWAMGLGGVQGGVWCLRCGILGLPVWLVESSAWFVQFSVLRMFVLNPARRL